MLRISRLFAHVDCNRSKPLVVHLAIFLIFAGISGCAKNHYYIEPNGQVTTVGHQPFWGPTRVNPDPVHLTEVPTTIAGAKVVSSAHSSGSATVGVVNPAIPEAVVVQQPVNAGSTAEPGLVSSGASSDAPATQVSGGVKKIAKANGPTIE